MEIDGQLAWIKQGANRLRRARFETYSSQLTPPQSEPFAHDQPAFQLPSLRDLERFYYAESYDELVRQFIGDTLFKDLNIQFPERININSWAKERLHLAVRENGGEDTVWVRDDCRIDDGHFDRRHGIQAVFDICRNSNGIVPLDVIHSLCYLLARATAQPSGGTVKRSPIAKMSDELHHKPIICLANQVFMGGGMYFPVLLQANNGINLSLIGEHGPIRGCSTPLLYTV